MNRHGRQSIRARLLLLALLPLGVVLPLMLLALSYWGGDYFERILKTKVRSELAIAHGYFERVSDGVGRSLSQLADSERLARARRASGGQDSAALRQLLDSVRREQKLDFLHFVAAGRPAINGKHRAVVAAALEGRSMISSELFSAEELHEISPQLAEQARTPLLPTPNAKPDARAVETRGLVIDAAVPVRDANGRLIGILEGGVLLNKNLAFIDHLNSIVYPDGALPFGSIGTTTLFLDDVRVATNVRLFGETRAIGTRVSATVHDAVLLAGKTWLDRAFVVSDWYVSAYEPLLNSQQQRIGMLYVGFLEAPFSNVRKQVILGIAVLFAVAMMVAGIFAGLWARRVFKPIERMHATMHAIENGQLEARVGLHQTNDELGIVAAHFDRLLDQLHAQAESLDAKVGERTAALEQAVATLKTAQSQLVKNEKLAAIGQLTAGLAHEINNPIAVIQGNLDVLRDILGAAAEPATPEIRLIHEQVQRIRLIVAKLLQFARPQDYVGYLEAVQPQPLVQDSLVLVQHLLRHGKIAIAQRIESTRQINCNKNEVQQVLINLLVNAIQAMPDGGVLGIGVDDWDESDMPVGICLQVSDSGSGIGATELEHLFEPFFTAKKPGGNGLGLWVSKTLIERYGGRLTVHNTPGKGACFSVWLRCEPLD